MIPDFLVTLYVKNSTLPTISPKSPSSLARITAAASYPPALLFLLLSYNLISIQWSEWALKNLKHSPWWLSCKESTCNVGDLGSIPGLGRSPGEGNGYPLQCSGLKNSMDCIVCGVTKSQTWLSDFHRAYHSPVQNLPLTPISRIKSKDLAMAIEVLCILVPTPPLTSVSTLFHLQALLLLVQIPEKAISPKSHQARSLALFWTLLRCLLIS